MLPVADVVAEVQEGEREHIGAWIEGVEVEIEDIDAAVVLVVDDYCGVFARRAAGTVGCGTAEPCWGCGRVIVGGQVDICAELVDIEKCERAGRIYNGSVVDLWCDVVEESCQIGGEVRFLAV